VVPAGLTKYREGLYPLPAFTKTDAADLLATVHRFQEQIYAEFKTHFIHAADEWYMLAGEELPAGERYDGYLQLENGVGMMRLFLDEFEEALTRKEHQFDDRKTISIATGLLSYHYIKNLADRLTVHFPSLTINVFGITNNFFGENITVSGLLTGTDLINQLEDKPLGSRLLLPINILRHDEDVFLDGVTISQLQDILHVPVNIVKASGYDFIDAALES
jgi:NifB/MoaA-like Fe-S oxidoreductase